jgi:hypothetical protein
MSDEYGEKHVVVAVMRIYDMDAPEEFEVFNSIGRKLNASGVVFTPAQRARIEAWTKDATERMSLELNALLRDAP